MQFLDHIVGLQRLEMNGVDAVLTHEPNKLRQFFNVVVKAQAVDLDQRVR